MNTYLGVDAHDVRLEGGGGAQGGEEQLGARARRRQRRQGGACQGEVWRGASSKGSPIWLVWSPRCSLNAKMSTCAKVTGRHKSSERIMVCFEMCSDGNKRRGGASSTELGSKAFGAGIYSIWGQGSNRVAAKCDQF